MKRGGVFACAVFLLLTPAGLGILEYAKRHPAWTETVYSLGWYRNTERFLTSITGPIPFSCMEWLLLLCGLAAALYCVSWIRELRRRPGDGWKVMLKRAAVLGSAVSGIFFWFVLTGQPNYHRIPLAESLRLTVRPAGGPELKTLCRQLAAAANESRASSLENEKGCFRLRKPFADVADEASEAVRSLDALRGTDLFQGAGDTRPKPMIFSEVMSYLRLSGAVFPYVMEANVNTDQMEYHFPSTMCHELAHVAGFFREDEANFIAYLACRESGDADFAYSGNVLALVYAADQLYRVSPGDWREVMRTLDPAVLRDFESDRRYWDRHDTGIGKAADRMNDAYLKANGQTDGVRSYGRMVDLLIALYRAEGRLAV